MQLIWAYTAPSETVSSRLIETTVTSKFGFLNINGIIPLITNLDHIMNQISLRVTQHIQQLLPSCIHMIVKELSERIRLRSIASVIGTHLPFLSNNFHYLFGCFITLLREIASYIHNLSPPAKGDLST